LNHNITSRFANVTMYIQMLNPGHPALERSEQQGLETVSDAGTTLRWSEIIE